MEIKEKTGGRLEGSGSGSGRGVQVASGRELTCADNHFFMPSCKRSVNNKPWE